MTRCAVTEDLARHMAELDKDDRRADFHEDKCRDVEQEFKAIAEQDGLDDAISYLTESFLNEAINNAALILLGGDNNDYFEQLISTKADWLLDNED